VRLSATQERHERRFAEFVEGTRRLQEIGLMAIQGRDARLTAEGVLVAARLGRGEPAGLDLTREEVLWLESMRRTYQAMPARWTTQLARMLGPTPRRNEWQTHPTAKAERPPGET
jgi:hypothetical protein